MNIRQATLLDTSSLLVMLNTMHQEPEHKVDQVDWVKVSHTVVNCIGKGLVLIAETDKGEFAGSIGGDISTEWYSSAPLLGDYWYYVLPDHRVSPAAFQLMKHFEKLTEMNVKVGHVLGEDIDRKDNLFEKLGFFKSGSLYRKDQANGRSM